MTYGRQVGTALGITLGFVTFIAVWRVGVARKGIDMEALKARFYPDIDHRHRQGDARVATETDAARDRVLAARAALGEELETLEASARAAVDIPAKVRSSPAKAAAVAGGTAFIVLGGPGRVFRRAKRAVRGPAAAAAAVDAARRDREDAALARQRRRQGPRNARTRLRRLHEAGAEGSDPASHPPVRRGPAPAAAPGASKAAAEAVFSTDEEGFQARLQQVQSRIARRERRTGADRARHPAAGATIEPGP